MLSPSSIPTESNIYKNYFDSVDQRISEGSISMLRDRYIIKFLYEGIRIIFFNIKYIKKIFIHMIYFRLENEVIKKMWVLITQLAKF